MTRLLEQGQSKRKTITKDALKYHIVSQMNSIGRKETLSRDDHVALRVFENLLHDCGFYSGFQHRGYMAFLRGVPNAMDFANKARAINGLWPELYKALTMGDHKWYYGADPIDLSWAEKATAQNVAVKFLERIG